MSAGFNLRVILSRDVLPARYLRELLLAGFNNFWQPKIGRLWAGPHVVDIGLGRYEDLWESALLAGELEVAPRLTSLAAWPDATRQISDDLVRLSAPGRFTCEFAGDYHFVFLEGPNVTERWLFRYGDDSWRAHIMWCTVWNSVTPERVDYHGTTISFISAFPWFFLKERFAEEEPHYTTPETAQRNWSRLVDLAELAVDVAGLNNLERTALTLEGLSLSREQEWLIDHARRLPRLEVDFA